MKICLLISPSLFSQKKKGLGVGGNQKDLTDAPGHTTIYTIDNPNHPRLSISSISTIYINIYHFLFAIYVYLLGKFERHYITTTT